MKVTISIPEPLFESAQRLAAQRGITLSALAADALRHLLAGNTASSAPAFRLHTVRGRLVNPNVDLDRASALVVTEDEVAFRSKPAPILRAGAGYRGTNFGSERR